MRILVNSKEMKQIDKDTIEETKIPSMVLMERAALAVAEVIRQRVDAPSVLCVCGCGNNGADGLAVARILLETQIPTKVLILGKEEAATKEWKQQREILGKLGIPVVTKPCLAEYTVIVDAIFGIGLSRKIEGSYAEWIEKINKSGVRVISIDIPSGISADTGEVLSIAVKADITVTFGLLKAGLIFYPGAFYAGEILVKEIGFPKKNIDKVNPMLYTCGKEALSQIPRRMPDSNKGSVGKICILAGSKNMAGAAYLAAKVAYRMGVGLVRIITSEVNREILQVLLPEAVLVTYQGGQDIKEVLHASFHWADVVAAGPGLGMEKDAFALIEVLSEYADKNKEKNYVLDADALNILAKKKEWMERFSNCAIITPHIGEMARFMETDIVSVQQNRVLFARRVAGEYHIICALKDARTIVCGEDGMCYINTSGNSGMATAGSGDVLCGVIAGCLAMGLPAKKAAEIGVYLHGLAGDRAKDRLGEHGVMAQDIVEELPQVLCGLEEDKTEGENNGDRCKYRRFI